MLDLLSFIGNSVSEILLLCGVLSILIFLYMNLGLAYSILGFGIMSIIGSVIIELNKQKANRQQQRR